ncbi:DUF1499 domain-containing protein [Colwellia sp. UCD-KL20]|uniref:DUF1499 domain-containing protein n=1 Tax=Colwellia sp. UCD-KL20 TaxID=1917165 RepID=UPI00097050F8|nr:DUF1499 domain-containing protein [Colwellia sp. UCD-KL20]
MITKKIITICKLLTIPLLLGFPLAVIAYRLHLWSMGTSFKIIQFTGYASIVVLLIAIIIGLFALFTKQQQVIKSSAIVAILLAIPAVGLSLQAAKAKSLPFLHQVSTDTVSLPQFQAVLALRGEGTNPLEYNSEKLAPLQQEAYPELKPIISNLNTEQAFNKAVDTAIKLGWEVVAKDIKQGMIEAVDTTLLWGFKDDVAIRIQATDTGSKIDLRSISRIGGTDLGANAKRIKSFISAF